MNSGKNAPWRGPNQIPPITGKRNNTLAMKGPENLDPGWTGKEYTPNTSSKYFGDPLPEWGEDRLDPNAPGVNPDHVRARQVAHDAIVRHFVDKTPHPAPGEQKRAIFMVGGPAAGKSSMLRERFSDEEMGRYVVVNPDEVKNMLPEYRRGIRQRYWPAANNAHEESGYLSKRIFDAASSAGKHILIDGTGSKPAKYERQMKKLRDMGYRIEMMHID
ncbi:MAG: zeta toxin family protein, partial [Thermostichus sp. HHBFW_bins_43]